MNLHRELEKQNKKNALCLLLLKLVLSVRNFALQLVNWSLCLPFRFFQIISFVQLQDIFVQTSRCSISYTAWKVSVFGVFLVCIFPHSDWIGTPTQVLPGEYCKIYKKTYFEEHLRTAASVPVVWLPERGEYNINRIILSDSRIL